MNTRQKLTLGIAAIFMVTLTIVGVTYAYFVTRTVGDSADAVDVSTRTIESLEYGDGNGDVILEDVLPGTTVYKTFTVTNNDQSATQTYKIYLTNSVPEGKGQFLHAKAANSDEDVLANCYSADAKMSTETGADTTNCFVNEKPYNNIKITLFKLKEGKTLASSYTADPDAADADVQTLTSDQITYGKEDVILTNISIAATVVDKYVLKVEYLDTADNAIDGDNNQNIENLAGLSIKADIKY